MRPTALLAAMLLLLAPAARADVLVVDPADAAAFPDLPAAVAAAKAGDIVLVRPGDHTPSPEVIVDRSLSIVGEAGGDVAIGGVLVRDLAPDDRVVLSHLDIASETFSFQRALEITDCEGVVLVEDCTVTGTSGDFATPALYVDDSSNVVVSRSTFVGAFGIPDLFTSSPPERGALVVDSRVAFYHCTLLGGTGAGAYFGVPSGTPGTAGLDVVSSGAAAPADVRLFGTAIVGGDSGECVSTCATTGDPGGPGLFVLGPSIVRAVGSTWAGGAGELLQGGGTTPPGPELELDVLAALLEWDDVAPELSGPSTLMEGEATTLTFRGEQGELVRFFFALDFEFAPLPAKKGVYVPGMPSIGPLLLGALPASGELELPIVGPDLTSLGLDGVLTTWQAYARVDGTPELILGNPYELVLLADDL